MNIKILSSLKFIEYSLGSCILSACYLHPIAGTAFHFSSSSRQGGGNIIFMVEKMCCKCTPFKKIVVIKYFHRKLSNGEGCRIDCFVNLCLM